MAEGTVIRLDRERGIGSLRTEDGKEYDFTQTMVFKGKFKLLSIGSRVYFDPRTNPNMPGKNAAYNIKIANSGINLNPTPLPGRIQTRQDSHLSNTKTPLLPYGFVPVNSESAITDKPIWHDGSRPDDEKLDSGLLSGELRCTLTALTPLLPGNARYPIRDPEGEMLVKVELLKKYGFDNLKSGKQIAEPLQLPDGGVVIPGSALKGMIRHSLGALLSAPMERVGDRHYSYRPNLQLNGRGERERLVVRPALVKSNKNDGWVIEVFDNAEAALFVRKDAEERIHKASNNKVVSGRVPGVAREIIRRGDKSRETNHLIPSSGSMPIPNEMRLANYRGGIDGKGLLAAAFQKNLPSSRNPGPYTYDLALVPAKPDVELEIPASLYKRYLDDQSDVLANNKIGHLTTDHPLKFNADGVASAIENSRAFTPGQLIYVELTTDPNGNVTSMSRVVSCGHHFRYRWAFTSSVHRKNGKIRDCLTPLPCEQKTVVSEDALNGSPERLTGPRLLFGYVRDKNNPIGEKSFERLAGRIAINHAVTHGVPRFLGDPNKGYCVPLPILGQPKSSAWEFYLRQDAAKVPLTYGDLPGDEGGELAGRKFYRHQPRVTDIADIAATDTETIQSDQATLARFICAPGTEFRFAIRFTGLRPWELGALLVTLQPHRLLKKGIPNDYAHKLGLGRPLGMGSVRLNIDSAIFRPTGSIGAAAETDTEGVIANAVIALAKRLLRDAKQKSLLCLWLDIHSFKDSGRLDYPHGGKNNTIFDWHTDRRREYSKLRRKPMPDWVPFFSTINERKNFPSYHTEDDFIDVV